MSCDYCCGVAVFLGGLLASSWSERRQPRPGHTTRMMLDVVRRQVRSNCCLDRQLRGVFRAEPSTQDPRHEMGRHSILSLQLLGGVLLFRGQLEVILQQPLLLPPLPSLAQSGQMTQPVTSQQGGTQGPFDLKAGVVEDDRRPLLVL